MGTIATDTLSPAFQIIKSYFKIFVCSKTKKKSRLYRRFVNNAINMVVVGKNMKKKVKKPKQQTVHHGSWHFKNAKSINIRQFNMKNHSSQEKRRKKKIL